MVGEAVAYVRGSKGLKATANPLRCGFSNSPIARVGGCMLYLLCAATAGCICIFVCWASEKEWVRIEKMTPDDRFEEWSEMNIW